MNTMVRTAMAIEREVDVAQNFYSLRVLGTRPWLSRPSLGQGFHCHQPGHLRWDCPHM